MTEECFLFDSSIWIDLIRGKVHKGIQREAKRLLAEEKVVVSPIVILEILRGSRSESEYRKREENFKALPSLSVTDLVWEKSYHLAFVLRQRGFLFPLSDILIAATAIHYDYTLMHTDKHFETIARHSTLKTRTL